MTDPFDFDDVSGSSASLADADVARVTARMTRGESPMPAAAALARRGDERAARWLAGAVAFVSPEDLSALARTTHGVDALAALVPAAWIPLPQRIAAADALADAVATPAAAAALLEVAEGPQRPPLSQCQRAHARVDAGLDDARREARDRLRGVAKQVRDGVRGTLRRQEFQRAVADGSMHPVVGVLVGDQGAFLAGLLPPIADEAREALLPYLLTVARAPDEAQRQRVFGVLQKRWREAAAPSLSLVARTPWKARESTFAALAARALGAMGAVDELVSVAGSVGGGARAAALDELARLCREVPPEIDAAVWSAAMTRAAGDPTPAVRARAESLARLRGASTT